MLNKKGSTVIWSFVIIFVALLFSIFLGIIVYTFNTTNTVLSQDVDIGQVNLQNVTATTFGQINTGMINNADTIGIIFLFGMILLMIINGYFIGGKLPKLFFIIDIFLLALFFIPSIYVSQIYETFIYSTDLFESTFTDIIPKVSKFMLNLPIIIGTAGIITMIVSYAALRKEDRTEGDGANVLGY